MSKTHGYGYGKLPGKLHANHLVFTASFKNTVDYYVLINYSVPFSFQRQTKLTRRCYDDSSSNKTISGYPYSNGVHSQRSICRLPELTSRGRYVAVHNQSLTYIC